MPSDSIQNALATGEAAQWLSPDDLTPWSRNPRDNDANVARVAESIKRFGFSAPIVARAADRVIIAGHTRWKAAKQLGLTTVPVRLMDLSERDAELLALADNRLNELAPWQTHELQQLLSDFSLPEVELAGWASADLDKMAAELVVGEGDFPELPTEPTHVQMTFTLSQRQKDIVEAAVARAKANGADSDDNDNTNGNALALVCEAFRG